MVQYVNGLPSWRTYATKPVAVVQISRIPIIPDGGALGVPRFVELRHAATSKRRIDAVAAFVELADECFHILIFLKRHRCVPDGDLVAWHQASGLDTLSVD